MCCPSRHVGFNAVYVIRKIFISASILGYIGLYFRAKKKLLQHIFCLYEAAFMLKFKGNEKDWWDLLGPLQTYRCSYNFVVFMWQLSCMCSYWHFGYDECGEWNGIISYQPYIWNQLRQRCKKDKIACFV